MCTRASRALGTLLPSTPASGSASVYTAASLTQGLALEPATHCFSWDLPSLSGSRPPTPEDRGLRALSQAGRGQWLPTQHLCDSMRSCPDRAPPEEPAHTPSAFSPREARLLLRRGAADPVGPSPPVPEGGRYREHPQERQTSTEQTLVQKALGTRLVSG